MEKITSADTQTKEQNTTKIPLLEKYNITFNENNLLFKEALSNIIFIDTKSKYIAERRDLIDTFLLFFMFDFSIYIEGKDEVKIDEIESWLGVILDLKIKFY